MFHSGVKHPDATNVAGRVGLAPPKPFSIRRACHWLCQCGIESPLGVVRWLGCGGFLPCVACPFSPALASWVAHRSMFHVKHFRSGEMNVLLRRETIRMHQCAGRVGLAPPKPFSTWRACHWLCQCGIESPLGVVRWLGCGGFPAPASRIHLVRHWLRGLAPINVSRETFRSGEMDCFTPA